MTTKTHIISLDKRVPILEKVGCYFGCGADGNGGFSFFRNYQDMKLKDNDVFIYKEGILWRLKR